MTRVRVMSYNILMGGRNGSAVHRVVRGSHSDVLLVNESPKTPLLWRRRCRRLADQWGMRYVTGGRSAGSNMIVVGSDVTVRRAGSEVLRQPLFQPRRGIAWAQLKVQGRLLGVVACHLSLDPARRLDEVRRVIELARGLRGSVVIAGDLNEVPTGPSWRALRDAGFVDHGSRAWLTFPAEAPVKRIDALLTRGEVDVVHHGGPELAEDVLAAASDHLPVVADLRLR